jgi:integrase
MVVDAFKLACGDKGELYAPSHQGRMLRQFFDLLDFARREGIAGDLSPRFVRHPGHHSIKQVDDNEDEIGKAIPEGVIGQLDQHLDLLGKGFPYGAMPPEAVTGMFRAIYVILRDTGRRPAEVAGLDLDCLEYDQGEYQLVWHNMKGKRLRRRLPVVRETADAVRDWKETRAGLDIPANCAAHLFPAVTGSYQHLDSGYISRAIRLWADSIPVLESGEPGRDGTPLPFDRSKIFPYAFRHTFCQRYADAGIALHVLQSLMDHRSADTTSAYYQVSKKMKREAVNTLRVLAVDRTGAPAPIGSATAYEMRSVAVPWGNCNEPSNVKAGGGSCPIRWQCPACSHYNPDPSHLPAIEDQVRALKASLETARAIGAALYTIAGIEGEIADYGKVIDAMKAQMDAMPAAERREVEEASKVLRRLRAGAAGPVPLPMPAVRPAERTA